MNCGQRTKRHILLGLFFLFCRADPPVLPEQKTFSLQNLVCRQNVLWDGRVPLTCARSAPVIFRAKKTSNRASFVREKKTRTLREFPSVGGMRNGGKRSIRSNKRDFVNFTFSPLFSGSSHNQNFLHVARSPPAKIFFVVSF